jgi:uncharacterized protein (TIGR02391 family)
VFRRPCGDAVGVHADVLRFCRAELVTDNYFHAVLEATKSIADKLRTKSGLSEDGSKLVDATLCGSAPRVAINDLLTDSQRSEQSGFANLVKGTFGMFRNPTAHEARVLWAMSKEDAEDLLSLASLIHRPNWNPTSAASTCAWCWTSRMRRRGTLRRRSLPTRGCRCGWTIDTPACMTNSHRGR